MTGILDRIDATLDGLCPCGAPPQPGSAYCSDDCTPTWRGRDTVSDLDHTAMRWRPDLVTAVNDSGLTLMHEFRRGRYNAQVFEYGGTDRIHCRLDDGHRFVGTDTDGYQLAEPDGLTQIWERLEQELGNAAHLEDDPWADVIGVAHMAEMFSALPAMLRNFERAFTSAADSVNAWAATLRDRFEANQRILRIAVENSGGPLLDGSVSTTTPALDTNPAMTATVMFDNSWSVFSPDVRAQWMSESLAASVVSTPQLLLRSIGTGT